MKHDLCALLVCTALNTFLYSQQVQYMPCIECNSVNHDDATETFTYGNIRPFEAQHVVSDYGPRDLGSDHYDWHGGVDYSSEGGDADLGDAIIAVSRGYVSTCS